MTEQVTASDGWRDKTIVVSGAASGIGAATARRLMAAGARVIALDLRPPAYSGAEFHPVDLGDAAAIDALAAKLPARLDGLANIAGLPGNRGVDLTMRVNYLGLRHLTETLSPRLTRGAGIVNLASAAGNQWPERVAAHRELARCGTFDEGARWLAAHPVPPETVYQYSKEALIVWTMVRAGALFRERGVRINCVSPGPVDTPILEDFRNTLGQAKVAQAIEIMGRPGLPRDIAPVVTFLLSNAAGWIAGENLRVDGALTATRAMV